MIAARSETVTVLFTDVVGSTAWRVRVGGRTADEQSAELERAIRDVVVSYGGIVVKSLGDGVMATFTSALDALEAAVMVQATARRLAIGGAESGVRIGISSGDMVREGSDWVGRAAIEAARLCSEAADHGRVLVADATALLTRGRTDRSLRRCGLACASGVRRPNRCVRACRPMTPRRWYAAYAPGGNQGADGGAIGRTGARGEAA